MSTARSQTTVQGRTQATAAKNRARQILPGSLLAIANYLQGVSNNDLATLRPSGSQANDNGKAQSSFDKRGIQMIDSAASKQWVEVAVLLL